MIPVFNSAHLSICGILHHRARLVRGKLSALIKFRAAPS
jgi:hypothetical protein